MKTATKYFMKIVLVVMISSLLALMLFGCRSNDTPETTQPPTTVPTEPTTVPTTVPPTTDPGPQELSSTEIAQLAGPATVTVHTNDGLGTGFFIDDKGTLVTCYHVIDGANALSVELADGGFYEVNSIIDFSEMYDVAVLEVNISGNAYLNLFEGEAEQGQPVYALGSSRGLDGTFSNGIISAKEGKVGPITCVQTTAAVSGGNSGGPLMNVYGEVVGINAMTRTDGQNLNFAIVVSTLDNLSMDKYWDMSQYMEWYDKEIKRSYLVYDYQVGMFARSKIHTYQSVTGSDCLLSMNYWKYLKEGDIDHMKEGYVDDCGIFCYAYSQSEMDQYTDYLQSIGFGYSEMTEHRDWAVPGTTFRYVNAFTGVEAKLFVFKDETLIFVEVSWPA